jgi:PTS system nitrogen regulatory IIA component
MTLTEILTSDRVGVSRGSTQIRTKDDALHALAELLVQGRIGPGPSALDYYRVLCEREALQSTGIGEGVAIPHGAIDSVPSQVAAALICPAGVPFDAIDGRPVGILFAVVGPKRNTGEHLKTLARVSRLLRDASFREQLLASTTRTEAYDLIRVAEEGRAA